MFVNRLAEVRGFPVNPFHATGLFLYSLKVSENFKETSGMKWVNPLSANLIKWSNALKQFVGF